MKNFQTVVIAILLIIIFGLSREMYLAAHPFTSPKDIGQVKISEDCSFWGWGCDYVLTFANPVQACVLTGRPEAKKVAYTSLEKAHDDGLIANRAGACILKGTDITTTDDTFRFYMIPLPSEVTAPVVEEHHDQPPSTTQRQSPRKHYWDTEVVAAKPEQGEAKTTKPAPTAATTTVTTIERPECRGSKWAEFEAPKHIITGYQLVGEKTSKFDAASESEKGFRRTCLFPNAVIAFWAKDSKDGDSVAVDGALIRYRWQGENDFHAFTKKKKVDGVTFFLLE